MTALGLVDTLRAKTRTVGPATLKDDDYGWGTYKVCTELRLSRATFGRDHTCLVHSLHTVL